MGEQDELRTELAARLSKGWERLDDTVDELASLHDVTKDELHERVDRVFDEGHPEDNDGPRDSGMEPQG
jgi:hypothetical protein